MCSPVRASQIAHALKPPRVSVLRSLEELMKHGYLERVGPRLQQACNRLILQPRFSNSDSLAMSAAMR